MQLELDVAAGFTGQSNGVPSHTAFIIIRPSPWYDWNTVEKKKTLNRKSSIYLSIQSASQPAIKSRICLKFTEEQRKHARFDGRLILILVSAWGLRRWQYHKALYSFNYSWSLTCLTCFFPQHIIKVSVIVCSRNAAETVIFERTSAKSLISSA